MDEASKKLHTSLYEVEDLLTEKLVSGGRVTFSPKGVSMLPMLRAEGDSVTLVRPPARIKKGTVALFISEADGERKYLLHRLVAVKNGEYLFCGDKRKVCDPPVSADAVIGVVDGYTSRGREHSLREPWYRVYSAWMVATYRIRKTSLKIQDLVYRLWKKISR